WWPERSVRRSTSVSQARLCSSAPRQCSGGLDRRFTNDQPAIERSFPLSQDGYLSHSPEQHPSGFAALFRRGLLHRGKWRRGERGQRHIVEAHDSQIAGNRQAPVAGGGDRAHGREIIARENRRRRSPQRQQLFYGGIAIGLRGITGAGIV